MSEWQLNTPVAFIIFNRPDTAQRVFAEIRRARPPQLLVIADGPRRTRPQEEALCRQTRSVIEGVDWPCQVTTNYSDVNLGCRDRVASGIDWVFSLVPEAIILEDDCLPHPSFFRYCAELLERYRDDERIGMITGTNLAPATRARDASYYFSKYTCIWGWASWKRAWAYYDRSASVWPEFLRSGGLEACAVPGERVYWGNAFDGVYHRSIDTWDYQWTLSSWAQSLLMAVPERNLISNIGFGPAATHTHSPSPFADIPTLEMSFPLTHPRLVLADRKQDAALAALAFGERFRSKVRRLLGLSRRRRRASAVQAQPAPRNS